MEKIDIISDISLQSQRFFIARTRKKAISKYIYIYIPIFILTTHLIFQRYIVQLMSGGTLIVYNIFLECVQSREIIHSKFKQSLLSTLMNFSQLIIIIALTIDEYG